MEQRIARVEATVDQRVQAAAEDIKAEVRAEVKAEYETRLDRQQARIDELEARMEGPESGQGSVREDARTTDGQPAQAEKKPDILKTGDLKGDPLPAILE